MDNVEGIRRVWRRVGVLRPVAAVAGEATGWPAAGRQSRCTFLSNELSCRRFPASCSHAVSGPLARWDEWGATLSYDSGVLVPYLWGLFPPKYLVSVDKV